MNIKIRRYFIPLTTLISLLFTNIVCADSPLPGIIEYSQQVVMLCSSNDEAKNVSLTPLSLPNNAKIAFSARWDDSNLQHLTTHKVMTKNGIKGTFYLNAWTNQKYGSEFCEKLLKGGSSLGAHTASHPFLPSINANQQFFEIMSVKVKVESDSNSLVSTMVLPFCQYGNSNDEQIQLDVGQSMMNSGYIGSPELYYGRYPKLIGYPSGTLAESALIRPGDRSVDEKKFNDTLEQYLNTKGKLDKNPSVSVGIHSWHSKDGIKTLDKLLAQSSQHKDWWYCNQNEYAAYRFEVNNIKIAKKVSGSSATFTITRFTPESLGANVDIYFNINNITKTPTLKSPQNAKIDNGMLVLPHASDKKIPAIIAVASKDNTSTKTPNIKCFFTVSDTIKPEIKLINNNKLPMTDVVLTLRSGAGFNPGVIVEKFDSINAQSTYTHNWKLTHSDSTRYNIGRPYHVIQIDYTLDGKRYRLYSEYRETKVLAEAKIPGTCAQVFVDPTDNLKLDDISKINSSLKKPDLIKLKLKEAYFPSENSIIFFTPKDEKGIKKDPRIIFILDFIPVKEEKILLKTSAQEMYLNGNKITQDKSKQWILPATTGKNRLVFTTTTKRIGSWDIAYLFTKGVKIREYLKAE